MQASRSTAASLDRRDRTADRRAFTLVELLASMTVLILLVVMVGQLVSSTVLTTVSTGKRIDSDSQARLIFDRMGSDFAGMVKRPDANFYFHHQTGNDALYFFTNATGYFASGDPLGTATSVRSSVSLAGYRVSDQISANTRFQLERVGRGLHWYDTSPGSSPNGPLTAMVYLPLTIAGSFSDVLTDPYNNSSNLRSTNASANDPNVPQWDVIGDQVLRLEFCFLLKDGTLAGIPVLSASSVTNNLSGSAAPAMSNDSTQGYSTGSRWYDATNEIGYVCVNPAANAAVWNPLGLQDVRAVVVAVAMLDNRSRLLVSSQSLTKLIGLLPDFNVATINANTSKPTLMDDAWNPVINGSTFATTAGISRAAAGSVRVYQQYFYLN